MGMGEAALRRLLRGEGALTPKALITQVCVEHAAELIRSGTKIEAALSLAGFHQKTNFNRQFRRMFGCLPHEYRNQGTRPAPFISSPR
jgi:AraC-like DNA-binding protein